MSILSTLVSSKLAVGAVAVGTLAVGGAAAAAATGVLPMPQTQNADAPFSVPASAGVPSVAASDDSSESASAEPSESETPEASDSASSDSKASSSASSSATPVGPDATGPAAFGLCTAFTKGGLNPLSIAYRNLAQAAGGASGIATYCATVVHPGQASAHMSTHPLPTQAAVGQSHATTPPHAAPSSLPSQAAAGMAHKPSAPGRP